MDLKTVVIMFSLINFTTGFLLVVLYLTFTRFLETKFWALGGLCFGISSALISLRGCDSGCGFNRFCEHTNIFIHGPSRHRNKNLPVAKNESPRIFSVCPFMWSSFFLYL